LLIEEFEFHLGSEYSKMIISARIGIRNKNEKVPCRKCNIVDVQ